MVKVFVSYIAEYFFSNLETLRIQTYKLCLT